MPDRAIAMTVRVARRLEMVDPGFTRTRRGVRTTCASLLSGLTLAGVTSVFDATDAPRISLFGAGACFFAALLVTELRRGDRARMFGWASVVSAVAIVVTVELGRTAVGAATAFLILQMFLSYAIRPWSPRAGNLAVIGALITLLVGAMRTTSDQIGWLVLASTVGFAWITISEYVILPDDPVRALRRSVDAFCRSTGEAVAAVIGVLATRCDGDAPHPNLKALRRSLGRVMRCRTAIECQLPGTLLPGLGQHGVEQLRVSLYCAERGIEEVINQANDPWWLKQISDDIVGGITSMLTALANALKDNVDAKSLGAVADEAERLRSEIHAATTTAPKGEDAPDRATETALAALTTVGGAQLLAQSTSQATALASLSAVPAVGAEAARAAAAEQTGLEAPPAARTLAPTMALALQATVAAVLGALIAIWLGNDQSLLVVWIAYVVIAGSAEASTRRAWIWLGATILGATTGVAISAIGPNNIAWIVGVVTIGVFFTVVSAPVSYPAMVFWMSIALVPLVATEGRYLDLIWDKVVAALIGGCVAGVVALTVAPMRLSRDLHPAVLHYLDALDAALESQLRGERHRRATAGAALDRAHSALDSMIVSAVVKTRLFPQPVGPLTEQGIRIDAVHEAFLRLTPSLTDSSWSVHGWTDQQLEMSIRRLRDDVEHAKAAVRGDPAAATTFAPLEPYHPRPLWLTDNLHTRLAELARVLRGDPRLRAAVR